jgi:hypothetical protein
MGTRRSKFPKHRRDDGKARNASDLKTKKLRDLITIEETIQTACEKHNAFLRELGLPPFGLRNCSPFAAI